MKGAVARDDIVDHSIIYLGWLSRFQFLFTSFIILVTLQGRISTKGDEKLYSILGLYISVFEFLNKPSKTQVWRLLLILKKKAVTKSLKRYQKALLQFCRYLNKIFNFVRLSL
jgi:hypothetical protein